MRAKVWGVGLAVWMLAAGISLWARMTMPRPGVMEVVWAVVMAFPMLGLGLWIGLRIFKGKDVWGNGHEGWWRKDYTVRRK